MHNSTRPARRLHAVTAALVSMLLVIGASGCGSTKVMTAQKSIAYKDRIYNISVVREVSGVRQLILPGGQVLDLTETGDRARRDLFEAHDELAVRMVVMLDDRELVYFDREVGNRRDLRILEDRFDDAMDRIRRFMANRRQTQLDLD